MLRVGVRWYSNPHSPAGSRKNAREVMETMPDTDTMEAKVSDTRVWLFRVLVVAAAAVMLVSWFLPWWTIDIEALGKNIVQIHPWGLAKDERLGGFAVLLKGADMPGWFAPFMWAYLGACMIALLVGSWVQGIRVGIANFKIKLSQLLIGGVGFSYIVVGVVAAVYASMRLGATFDVPLQGRAFLDLGDPLVTYVDTRLLFGYYLIYVAALLFLVLALLHDKITGEPKPDA